MRYVFYALTLLLLFQVSSDQDKDIGSIILYLIIFLILSGLAALFARGKRESTQMKLDQEANEIVSELSRMDEKRLP